MVRGGMTCVRAVAAAERGICAKHGRVHTKGACLGEDMILSSDFIAGFRDVSPAIALTFVVQVA